MLTTDPPGPLAHSQDLRSLIIVATDRSNLYWRHRRGMARRSQSTVSRLGRSSAVEIGELVPPLPVWGIDALE